MRRLDALGTTDHAPLCAHPVPVRAQPAEAPWRLALTTVRRCAEVIAAPDEPEARYGTQRGVAWVVDTGHLTEPCADGPPQRIIPGLTMPAPDGVMGPTLHPHVATRDLLPSTHLRDGGDGDAERLVTAHPQPPRDARPGCLG
jgi:hypothetical protein